jgi:serine/threonine protein kinase
MPFYGCEMILTLEYLHSHQIIYRDLKPENIILNMKQNGHISLVDFGFSKFCRNQNAKCVTNCGTPVYIAPEILRGSGYSYEADVWSFGVLMVEIASG